jgi:hypothetical protein
MRRQAREDPMSAFVAQRSDSRREQSLRVAHLKRILGEIKEIQREAKRSRKKRHSHSRSHRHREKAR